MAYVQEIPRSNNQRPIRQRNYSECVKPRVKPSRTEEERCPASAQPVLEVTRTFYSRGTFIAMYPNEGEQQVQVFHTSDIFRPAKVAEEA